MTTTITANMQDAATRQISHVNDDREVVAFYCAAGRECAITDQNGYADGELFDADQLRHYPSTFFGSFFCIKCHIDSRQWEHYPTLDAVLRSLSPEEFKWVMQGGTLEKNKT